MVKKQITMVNVWKDLKPSERRRLGELMGISMGALALTRITKVYHALVDSSGHADIQYKIWRSIRVKKKSQRIR
jgi:hypothetical protein